MKWYYNLKINTKLVGAFISVALLATVIGIYGIVNLQSIAKNDKALYSENLIGLSHISNLQRYFLQKAPQQAKNSQTRLPF